MLLAAWVRHERRYGRTREPVVNLDLFRIRSYVLGAGVGLLYFAGFTGTFFILTQYLQIGLDYPAWKAGLAATPFAIGGALMSSLGSRQVLRRGRKLVAFGLGTVIVGLRRRVARGARRAGRATSRSTPRCRCCWPGSAAASSSRPTRR